MIKKVVGLIPVRIGSQRLPAKALLPINNIPLILHVYNRAKLSKKLNDVFVCCDSRKIYKIIKDNGGRAIMTSKNHKNGTERIAQAYKLLKKKYDFVLDIQGDEPLIDPKHIDYVVDFHLKNFTYDIVLPSIKIKKTSNENIIKIVKDINNNVLYMSRATIPFIFKKSYKYLNKHLSIISFKPDALMKYSRSKQTKLEKIESIELLRALEIGLKIKSPNLKGDSFSVDVKEDYIKAKSQMLKDKYFKLYK